MYIKFPKIFYSIKSKCNQLLKLLPRVDAAEMVTEKNEESEEEDDSVERTESGEPKKKKAKKQKIGFRDRKVE